MICPRPPSHSHREEIVTPSLTLWPHNTSSSHSPQQCPGLEREKEERKGMLPAHQDRGGTGLTGTLPAPAGQLPPFLYLCSPGVTGLPPLAPAFFATHPPLPGAWLRRDPFLAQ